VPLSLGSFKVSGSKTTCQLTADSQAELERAARLLNEDIHTKGWQEPHLDLTPKKAAQAIDQGAITDDGFDWSLVT